MDQREGDSDARDASSDRRRARDPDARMDGAGGEVTMLVAKRLVDEARVVAAEERRDAGPWCCPSCAIQVFLKKGEVKVHHFAHRPPVSCEYGSGESEEHRRCKTTIYEALRSTPGCSRWELERDLGSVRPDVSGYVGNTPVAVEVQASSLGLERIAHRTKEYANKGIFVLWLVPEKEERLLADPFAPSVWEKWLHTLYFGRVYYWLGEKDRLTPVHFDDHMIYVPLREWYDKENNEDRSAGGYSRRSKRYREVNAVNAISIAEMQGVDRTAWSRVAGHNIPNSKLWMDRFAKWWASDG